jgi:hypothetical protein
MDAADQSPPADMGSRLAELVESPPGQPLGAARLTLTEGSAILGPEARATLRFPSSRTPPRRSQREPGYLRPTESRSLEDPNGTRRLPSSSNRLLQVLLQGPEIRKNHTSLLCGVDGT